MNVVTGAPCQYAQAFLIVCSALEQVLFMLAYPEILGPIWTIQRPSWYKWPEEILTACCNMSTLLESVFSSLLQETCFAPVFTGAESGCFSNPPSLCRTEIITSYLLVLKGPQEQKTLVRELLGGFHHRQHQYYRMVHLLSLVSCLGELSLQLL